MSIDMSGDEEQLIDDEKRKASFLLVADDYKRETKHRNTAEIYSASVPDIY